MNALVARLIDAFDLHEYSFSHKPLRASACMLRGHVDPENNEISMLLMITSEHAQLETDADGEPDRALVTELVKRIQTLTTGDKARKRRAPSRRL